MYKDERPHKCLEHVCEELRGFTYLKGLARHRLEVHKETAYQIVPRLYPIPDCEPSFTARSTEDDNRIDAIRKGGGACLPGRLSHRMCPPDHSTEKRAKPGLAQQGRDNLSQASLGQAAHPVGGGMGGGVQTDPEMIIHMFGQRQTHSQKAEDDDERTSVPEFQTEHMRAAEDARAQIRRPRKGAQHAEDQTHSADIAATDLQRGNDLDSELRLSQCENESS